MDNALGDEILGDGPDLGYCREDNSTRGVRTLSVVQVTYVARDAQGLPAYIFQFLAPEDKAVLKPHDHREVRAWT